MPFRVFTTNSKKSSFHTNRASAENTAGEVSRTGKTAEVHHVRDKRCKSSWKISVWEQGRKVKDYDPKNRWK